MRNIVKSFGSWLVGKASSSSKFASEMGITGGDANKLTNPYEKSVWVNRAIKKIATPIASMPLAFSDPETKESLEDAMLSKFWRNPFLGLTFEDGIEATVGWLKLKGECFWIVDDSWMVTFPNGEMLSKSKILIPNPARMKEVVEGGQVIGWQYRDEKGKSEVFHAEQVIHHKFWNPHNPHRGLAEMKCAEIAAESDFLAGTMARNLNRSNGDRGVYVLAKGGGVTGDQREQILAQLRAKQRANQNGKAVATFLNGGDFSIEDPKLQSLDTAQLTARLHNRHEIFIAFGVPPSMADIQSSYSIGAASDRYVLIEDTCVPTGVKICGGVETISAKLLGREVIAKFDWRKHSVMRQVRAEELKSADSLWSKGMPMREVNETLDLGISEYPGWETGYLPMNLLPAADVAAGANDLTDDPAYAEKRRGFTCEDRRSPEVDDMLAALRNSSSDIRHRKSEEGEADEDFQGKRSKKEIALWNSHMASRRATAKKYQSAFTRTLFAARKHVLQRIDELYQVSETQAKSTGAKTRAAAGDLIFDLHDFEASFFAAMRKVSKIALQEAGQQVYDEIDLDDVFTMADPHVLMHLRARENLMKNVCPAIHRQAMDALEEGIQSGESTRKLAARMKATFNGISDSKAMTLAQTETGAVFSAGRADSMAQSGVTHKQWLTSGNNNVRGAHAAANGQTVPIDEDFDVGGEDLAHPNDPNGSAENTINCHCIHIATKPPASN